MYWGLIYKFDTSCVSYWCITRYNIDISCLIRVFVNLQIADVIFSTGKGASSVRDTSGPWLTTSMSDDEFGNIPDEFADIQGVDWAALLCATGSEPAPATTSNEVPVSHGSETAISEQRHERIGASPISESRSSVYFSDSSNVDLAFLTELDLVEQQILFGQGPSSKVAQTGSPSRCLSYSKFRNFMNNLGQKSVVADSSHHVQSEWFDAYMKCTLA